MKSRWNSKRNVKRSFSWNGIIVNTACACVKEFTQLRCTYCMCYVQRNLPNLNCIDSVCLCTHCVPCAKEFTLRCTYCMCHVPRNLPNVVHTACAMCQGIYSTLYILRVPCAKEFTQSCTYCVCHVPRNLPNFVHTACACVKEFTQRCI